MTGRSDLLFAHLLCQQIGRKKHRPIMGGVYLVHPPIYTETSKGKIIEHHLYNLTHWVDGRYDVNLCHGQRRVAVREEYSRSPVFDVLEISIQTKIIRSKNENKAKDSELNC